ncbi:hypothetical protein ACIBJF_41160 [Streptomyces sp. NPDC050743]|uniref:hypothetical protein n=1 Tax=Streptomyces sp. NPDC050743 TaxID=3365634 RepID=UPI0037A06805
MSELRNLGYDAVTGKRAYALTEPGGLLDTMANVTALETASVLTALVGEVLEGGKASDAELAVFVPALFESLSEVVNVAARVLDAGE